MIVAPSGATSLDWAPCLSSGLLGQDHKNSRHKICPKRPSKRGGYCRSWACPSCGQIRASQWAERAFKALQWAAGQGLPCRLWTITDSESVPLLPDDFKGRVENLFRILRRHSHFPQHYIRVIDIDSHGRFHLHLLAIGDPCLSQRGLCAFADRVQLGHVHVGSSQVALPPIIPNDPVHFIRLVNYMAKNARHYAQEAVRYGAHRDRDLVPFSASEKFPIPLPK